MKDQQLLQAFLRLQGYCEQENFKGWDPYDGLNSKVFQALRLNKVRIFRLAWIQLFKRNPINLRALTSVPKEYNPKGLGLFLTAYCNLYQTNARDAYLEKINAVANLLIELKSEGYSGACWGYNFDWQSRAFFLPKYTPTVVATSFIANALIDAFEVTKNERFLEEALSSVDFVLNDLNRTSKKEGFIFSYSPYDNTSVYNASLLGSRLLARAYSYTGDADALNAASASVAACASAQQDSGAWAYGELDFQNWVDSFHTGYNLECIAEYQRYCKDQSYSQTIEIGLKYYLENFFTKDGIPKYYDTQTYPIDVHAPAQLVVTLFRLGVSEKHKVLVDEVLNWTVSNMQNASGYFYYQLKQGVSSRIPYMRWAQAWMFYALSYYFSGEKNGS